MTLTVAAKSAMARFFGFCRIPEAAVRNRAGKSYLILMYHRVVPPGRDPFPIQAGMYVDPETFEEHVRYLKMHFHPIPFSGKFHLDHAVGTSQGSRPACILTFDDGWRDFHEFAYPVLKRHGVPATVFLPTRYIGTSEWFWSDRLASLLTTAIPSVKTDGRGDGSGDAEWERIAALAGGYEKRLESAIALLKNLKEREIEGVIAELKKMSGAESFPCRRAFLNWDEIHEMKGSGLVSFGSHTHNHRILVHLEDEEIREELMLSKTILLREGAVEPSFIPFCYPNGSWNDRIACMVREAGYHATVSTGSGWNPEGASPFELKRVAIHQDMTRSRQMFGCRVAGIL